MDLESPSYDVIWLRIPLSTISIFICFIYLSPNLASTQQFFDYLTRCHESIITKHPSSEIIFAGDFNAHHVEWLGSSRTTPRGEQAFDFAALCSLQQLIQQPTRIPDRHDHLPNILDLFLTSNIPQYSYNILAPIGSSDHNLISVKCKWARPPPLPPSKRLFWHFDRARWNDLRSFFLDFPWGASCFSSRDVSVIADSVSRVIVAGMESCIPHSTKSNTSAKWFDGSCSDAVKQRDDAYRAWRQHPDPTSHSNYLLARNRTKGIIRRVKRAFIKRRCADLSDSNNTKILWSLTKSISSNFSNSLIPPLILPDNSVATSPFEKCLAFSTLFQNNSTLDDSNAPSPPNPPPSSSMPLPIFSIRRVRRALLNLDVSKAYGSDGIPPRVLRECAYELSPIINRLFRLIIKTKIFPSSWKHSLVQPIPKSGDRSNPSNYRPISITCTISKVFEMILNKHFLKHLENNSLLSDHQYGFRRARSTGDLLSYVTSIWSSALRDYGESFVVALDISKAFDRVWHKSLLSKLPSFGFPPSICALLLNYLSNRSISVMVDGSVSPPHSINSGVPQGCVLSPTLFLIFINDLLSLTSNPIHSYADDSTLHSSTIFPKPPSINTRLSSRVNTLSSLNNDLERIASWGADNLVNFNDQKTQFQLITLSNVEDDPFITFKNTIIRPTTTSHILGLTVSSNLSWKPHIQQIAKSASAKLGILFKCRPFFTCEQLLKIYKGLIRPCLEYCSHVWGGSTSTYLLDRVESKAFRLINAPHLTSQLPSLELRRDVASLSIFYKYYFGRCSEELSYCVPRPKSWGRNTRLASFSHEYCVEVGNTRIDRYDSCFFPYTGNLWNTLPSSVFPSSYNLSSFKCRVYRHLRGID